MSKTFVIGDIHGAYRALVQCLQRSEFDFENDILITLGDITDGWSEVVESFDLLLKIKNRIDIRGNHDEWLLDFLEFGVAKKEWLSQGGKVVYDRYIELSKSEEGREKTIKHRDSFLKKQSYYYIDNKNRLFVHGGYDWHKPLRENNYDDMMWDRHAFQTACMWESYSIFHPTDKKNCFKEFSEVFVGHTGTNHGVNFRIGNSLEPVHVSNLWNLDQGAGCDGRLSIMNTDTKQFWQSECVIDLYKDEKELRK